MQPLPAAVKRRPSGGPFWMFGCWLSGQDFLFTRCRGYAHEWSLLPGQRSTPHYGAAGEERVQASFGDNYPRLAALKGKFDPANLFRVNLEYTVRLPRCARCIGVSRLVSSTPPASLALAAAAPLCVA